MANLSQLTNHELINTLKLKTQAERRLTVEIIELLEETERRRLYLEKGFSSLMEFCIKELKYSESAAYRRISAMRLSREVPQVKEALSDGRLNLVNVAQAQTMFRTEARNNNVYSKEEKQELLRSLENISKREAEKILVKESPLSARRERVQRTAENRVHMNLVIEDALLKKLDKLKSLLSHKYPHLSYSGLIELLADSELKKQDPAREPERKRNAQPPVVSVRKISASAKRQVWQNSGGTCTYTDPITNRRCGSQFQLEIDHAIPVAKGGTDEPTNLRLLCRSHNLHFARLHFGDELMGMYTSLPARDTIIEKAMQT